MTIASEPVFFPEMAKLLLAKESLNRIVSGLLQTTANFADVVSGLETKGLKTKAINACSESGSYSAADSSSKMEQPSPLPPMKFRSRFEESSFFSKRSLERSILR